MDNHQDKYLKFGPYLDLMAGIRTALDINQGIIKIVGKNGTGKTSLCRQLEADLRAEGHEVVFFESPPESSDYLYRRIQSQLGLDKNKNFDRMLGQHLRGKPAPNNRLVIIYDDAEKVSRDIFILIRLLNNIHGEADTLVSQIICGTSKLDRIFDDPELRSLTQYLNQSFILEPMTREQLEDFHAGYLKAFAITAKPLDNKSLTDIYIKGNGLPGKTLELFNHHYQPLKSVSDPLVAPGAVPATAQPVTATPPTPVASTQHDFATISAHNNVQEEPPQEIRKILDDDFAAPATSAGIVFKLIVATMVVVVALILSFVLSGHKDEAVDRLVEIMADDSPLYLDEMDPVISAPATPASGNSDNALPATMASNDAIATPISPQQEDDIADVVPNTDDTVAQIPEVTAMTDLAVTGESAIVPDSAAEAVRPEADAVARDDTANLIESGLTVVDDVVNHGVAEAVTTPLPEEPGNDQDASMASKEEPGNEQVASMASTEEPGNEQDASMILTEERVGAVIDAWAGAWEKGDFAGYLAAYHDDFMTETDGARLDWENQRRARIENVAGISTDFDRIEITGQDENEATVRFWLYYSRGNYADDTHKEMIFRRTDGKWLIVSERNLEIITR